MSEFPGSRQGCFFVAKIALAANFAEFLSAAIGTGKGNRNKIKGLRLDNKLA